MSLTNLNYSIYLLTTFAQCVRYFDFFNSDELKAGLLDLGIEVSLSDMENLMIFFDRDHSGTISFNEFCDGIRGQLNSKRTFQTIAFFHKVWIFEQANFKFQNKSVSNFF